MQIDFAQKELTVKLVYYGPGLSGKTTNLQAIHWLSTPETCGDLMTLETHNDRTLFFDLLPISVESSSGLTVRIKLFTVPGQVMHNATRRMVLQAVDGVAFIADSQLSETEANRQSFLNMQENLRENGIDPETIPKVIQFNKRDLEDIRSDKELDEIERNGRDPIYRAIATRGFGVMQTLRGLIERTWLSLETEHKLEEKFGLEARRFLDEVSRKLRYDAGER